VMYFYSDQVMHFWSGVDTHAFALHLPPHLAHAVHAEVLIEDATDLFFQRHIALRPRRSSGRIDPGCGLGVVCRWGDLQHAADPLDPEIGAVGVDEGDYGMYRRSNSAWAKYALALRRISLALRSSLISRSIAFTRARSSVVTSPRRPRSRSACATQLCSVCGVQPILVAIETIAAHCEACSSACS